MPRFRPQSTSGAAALSAGRRGARSPGRSVRSRMLAPTSEPGLGPRVLGRQRPVDAQQRRRRHGPAAVTSGQVFFRRLAQLHRSKPCARDRRNGPRVGRGARRGLRPSRGPAMRLGDTTSTTGGRAAMPSKPSARKSSSPTKTSTKRDNDCCIWTVRQFATLATDPRPAPPS